jgi:SAM-dependent methyltransferase
MALRAGARSSCVVVPTNHFGEAVARRYDTMHADLEEAALVDPAIDFLAAIANGGAALEFGVGTGRLALPLSRRGVRVHGIELSPEMVARLAAKPGAENVGVTIGDFATIRVDGAFRVVYLVRNTIMNLTTQDEQVECFRNAAAHLEPGGSFVIEVLVPRLQRLPVGERFQPFSVTPNHLGFDEIDVATQHLVSHHYWTLADGIEKFSAPFRYVWPSELDLMAQIAGLALHERWSSWTRDPFTNESEVHVSVWIKP